MWRLLMKAVLIIWGIFLFAVAVSVLGAIGAGEIIRFEAIQSLADLLTVLKFLGGTLGFVLLGILMLVVGVCWLRRDLTYRHKANRFFREYDHYKHRYR